MIKKYLYTAAAVVILLIAVCIYLVSYFSTKESEILGLGTMAVDNSRLVVDAGDSLYLLDENGRVIAHKSYDELLMPAFVSWMQIKGETLYLSNSDNGSLYSCDLATWQCGVVSGFDGVARRTFGFWVGEDKVHITDTARHIYKEFDLHGNLLAESRGEEVPLCYPNQLIKIGDGLYTADTNNHRITKINLINNYQAKNSVAVKVARRDDSLWRQLEKLRSLPDWCVPLSEELLGKKGNAYFERGLDYNLSTRLLAPEGARYGRIWPISFARDHYKKWWVVAGGSDLRNGDVLVFEESKPPLRVNSGDDFDPFSVVAFQRNMLVTDIAAMEVVMYSAYGSRLGTFGDAVFKSDLKAIKKEKERYAQLVVVAQWIQWLLLLVAVLIAYFDRRLRGTDPVRAIPRKK